MNSPALSPSNSPGNCPIETPSFHLKSTDCQGPRDISRISPSSKFPVTQGRIPSIPSNPPADCHANSPSDLPAVEPTSASSFHIVHHENVAPPVKSAFLNNWCRVFVFFHTQQCAPTRKGHLRELGQAPMAQGTIVSSCSALNPLRLHSQFVHVLAASVFSFSTSLNFLLVWTHHSKLPRKVWHPVRFTCLRQS